MTPEESNMEDVTRQTEKKVNESAEKLRDGLDRARKQTVDTIEKAYPVADEAIEKAKAKSEELWDRAKAKGQDLIDDIEANSQQVISKVSSYIRKRPIQTIGATLLIGLAIGAVLMRRDND